MNTWDEEEFLSLPWWWMRHHILALFGQPDSLTGSRFYRDKDKDST